MASALWQRPDAADDFRLFYRAASLAAAHQSVFSHPSLAPDKNADGEFLPFARIPSYAEALRPIVLLPYAVARRTWIGVSILALAACVWLSPGRRGLAIALAFSFPVAFALVLGQDIAFVLLIALAAARVYRSEREFAAGLVASLLAIKFTYLPAVGLVFLAKSRRGTWGLLAGTALQFVLSFAWEGREWPFRYLALLRHPLNDPEPRRMLSVRAVAAGLSLPAGAFIIASIALYLGFWFVCKRLNVADALTLALPVALIASPHCYIYDAVVLVPLLVRTASVDSRKGRLALIGLTPLPYLLVLAAAPPLVLAGSVTIVVSTLAAALRLYRLHEAPVMAWSPALA
jgi:hypothetical protein